MIPCRDSANTLGRALQSLITQTYSHWEALVVDDGSTDNPRRVAESFNDSRIRFFRLDKPSGRPLARQTALDNARGSFLTMLDADDWILPEKFERQIEVLREHPELVLVSTSMFMVGRDGRLHGVLRYGEPGDAVTVRSPLARPGVLPVAHAPIMVRMPAVKGRRYDLGLPFSQDMDFFLPVLMENAYGMMPAPLYVYEYQGNPSLPSTLARLRANCRIFAKYLTRYPIAALWKIGVTASKIPFTYLLAATGSLGRFTARKFSTASEREIAMFEQAQSSRAMEPTGA